MNKILTFCIFRKLSLAVLMFAPVCSYAQYHSFIYQYTDSVSYWKNGVHYDTDDYNWLIHYDEREAYSIDGKTYMKVHSEPEVLPTSARGTNRLASLGDTEPRNYTLGIRKADGKVYVNHAEYLDHLSKTGFGEFVMGFLGNPNYVPYHLTDDGEMILYDYTMEVGEQYRHVEGYDDIMVTNKDAVILKDGKEHRRLELSNGLVLVEDLGCINSAGLLLDYLNPTDDCRWLNASLKYVLKGDNCLYAGVTPPAIDNIEKITHPKSLQVQASDLQGRRITGTPHPGIYIQQGRKQMVR